MLECPKCKYDNELGRIFCHQCGTKLDLSQVKPPTEGAKMRRRLQRGVAQTVRLVVEGIIVLVLVLAIVLICLAPEVAAVKPSGQELTAIDTKHRELSRLANTNRSGQIVLSEADLNVFLNGMGFEKAKGQGLEVTPLALGAKLTDNAVKIEFLGVIHFGTLFDKNLYLAYEGTPVIIGNAFFFKPTGGWIGKLPIHPSLVTAMPLFGNYFAHLFGSLTDERAMLDKLTSITVTRGSAVLEKEVPTKP